MVVIPAARNLSCVKGQLSEGECWSDPHVYYRLPGVMLVQSFVTAMGQSIAGSLRIKVISCQ